MNINPAEGQTPAPVSAPQASSTSQAASASPTAEPPRAVAERPAPRIHEVRFVTYPKLLFVWPLLVAGLVFYPFAAPPPAPTTETAQTPDGGPVAEGTAAAGGAPAVKGTPAAEGGGAVRRSNAPAYSARLETLGWMYVWIAFVVFLTLGVDVDRNQAAFWVVFIGGLWVLGLWLRDTRHFTLFGDIYRWFAGLDIQYNRGLGLVLSIVLLLPYVLMLLWARLNDRWRITHNEFEHYSFGKTNDSLGRGAKTIRTSYPDVLELLLGLAGTLIVYNATGTRELRRIPHVPFLPLVRKRLNRILEMTAITTGGTDDEEDDNTQQL